MCRCRHNVPNHVYLCSSIFLPSSRSSIFITKFNMVSLWVDFRCNLDLLPQPSATAFYFKGLLPSLDSIKNLDLLPLQTHFGSSTSWSSRVFHISCWRTYCLEHSFTAMLISMSDYWFVFMQSLSTLFEPSSFVSILFFHFGPHSVQLYILQYV